MILIKIDSLSTQELRNIAEQEGIDGYCMLSREDLILLLKEIYEEDEDVEISRVNRKFLNGLTDYREIDKAVLELPGVEELPETYPNTEIHMLYKNPNWAYCYWGISPQDYARLEELNTESLILRTTVTRGGSSKCFDISVSLEDRAWTVSLPEHGGECFVSLIVEDGNAGLELAHSASLTLVDSYWLEHLTEIKDSDSYFKIYMSLLTTKEGLIAESPLLDEILKGAEEG